VLAEPGWSSVALPQWWQPHDGSVDSPALPVAAAWQQSPALALALPGRPPRQDIDGSESDCPTWSQSRDSPAGWVWLVPVTIGLSAYTLPLSSFTFMKFHSSTYWLIHRDWCHGHVPVVTWTWTVTSECLSRRRVPSRIPV
jgi:amino acid transporter